MGATGPVEHPTRRTGVPLRAVFDSALGLATIQRQKSDYVAMRCHLRFDGAMKQHYLLVVEAE